MADFATIPGGNIVSGPGYTHIDANAALPAVLIYDNLIQTFGSTDTVYGRIGSDTVGRGNGSAWAHDESGADKAFSGFGSDTAYGDLGNDMIFGGDDRLTNLASADVNASLEGGVDDAAVLDSAGTDALIGGPGGDAPFGGTDRDAYVFQSGFGTDVVLDFKPGDDTLSIQSHINGLNITRPADLAHYISGTATTSTITLGNDTIRLSGISKADLLAHLDQYVRIV